MPWHLLVIKSLYEEEEGSWLRRRVFSTLTPEEVDEFVEDIDWDSLQAIVRH